VVAGAGKSRLQVQHRHHAIPTVTPGRPRWFSTEGSSLGALASCTRMSNDRLRRLIAAYFPEHLAEFIPTPQHHCPQPLPQCPPEHPEARFYQLGSCGPPMTERRSIVSNPHRPSESHRPLNSGALKVWLNNPRDLPTKPRDSVFRLHPGQQELPQLRRICDRELIHDSHR
jgi:hypothetical protein